ncbi:hypothetical protein Tco_0971173 [Tanacetum coccineum]
MSQWLKATGFDQLRSLWLKAFGDMLPSKKVIMSTFMERPSLSNRERGEIPKPKCEMKKKSAQGLEELIRNCIVVAEQMKILPKEARTQFIALTASGWSADEEMVVSQGKDDYDDAENEDDDGQDDDKEQTESYNDDMRVQTPSHFESTDEETYDEVTQGDNVEGEELYEEETNEEEKVNELYRDLDIYLERRDIEMTDALQTNVQDVPSSNVECVLHCNNTSIPTYSFSLNLSNNTSSHTNICFQYLDQNQMNEAVKVAVQLQSDRLRSEAQADNEDFINKIDENMKKIIKEQVKVQVKEKVSKILPKIEKFVNDQLKAEVLIRSSNEAKTSLLCSKLNLFELE